MQVVQKAVALSLPFLVDDYLALPAQFKDAGTVAWVDMETLPTTVELLSPQQVCKRLDEQRPWTDGVCFHSSTFTDQRWLANLHMQSMLAREGNLHLLANDCSVDGALHG